MVGVALDVGVAALGVHASAGLAHVAEQQLQQRARADELAAGRVVGEAYRVDDGHHLVGLAHLADEVRNLVELVDGDARDAGDDLWRVARVVGLHELEDRLRVLQGEVALGEPVGAEVVAPAAYVVRPLCGAVPGEQPIGETEGWLHEE